jgi:hypothetical protein
MSSFTDWFSDFFNTIFSGSSTTGTTNNSSMKKRSSPNKKNLTYGDTVDSELTKGLYHNQISGYKLGASLCYNPIRVPLSFMGVPHFATEDSNEFWNDLIYHYNNRTIQAKKNIQLICHRDGTAIIYPQYSAGKRLVEWKHIPVASVYRVLVDTFTDQITAIVTRESITYYDDMYSDKVYEETVIYTESNLIFQRSGTLPDNVPRNETRVNPVRGLPIIFTNQKEPGEFEGHSDYERIIPIIKAYSEVNKSGHETLINLSPKWVQSVSDQPDKWLTNNGITDINDVDVYTIDFVINKNESEKTEFVIPAGVVDGHLSIMKKDFQNIVETSGIPEIAWGLKTEGNHASAEEQMGILLSFVRDKQEQSRTPYLELLRWTVELESIANMMTPPRDLDIIWNDLDALSEKERSEIFKNYADGISALVEKSSIDLESIHDMLYEFTGGKLTNNFDEFRKNIINHGVLISELEQDPETIRLDNAE